MTIIRVGLPYSALTHLALTALDLRAPVLISMGSFYRKAEGGLSRPIGDAPWTIPCALDSAGFSAMVQWKGYPWTVEQHVEFVRTNGGLWRLPIPWNWWAAMDYCCEQAIASDRQQVEKRMRQTIESAEETLDWVDYWREEGDTDIQYPLLTLQGRTPADYLWSARELARVWSSRKGAFDSNQRLLLPELPLLLGVGSVCTRPLHGTEGLLPVLDALHAELPDYVKLHLFGVKGQALKYVGRYGDRVASVDSMAWDDVARREAGQIRKQRGVMQSGADGFYSCDLSHRAKIMRSWYMQNTQRK